jgi:hypothetical protein
MSVLKKCALHGRIAFFLPWLAACSSVSSLPVSDIFTSNQCRIEEQGIAPIDNIESLTAVIQKSQSSFMNKSKLTIPDVNFDASAAYVISMGSRPSGGYSINLKGQEATFKDGVVRLPVELVGPGNMFATQVMTSPCKIILLPKGDYKRVEIDKVEP